MEPRSSSDGPSSGRRTSEESVTDWPESPPIDEASAVLSVQRRVAAAMRLVSIVDIGPRADLPPGPVIHAANHRSLADLLLSTSTFSAWGWPIRPLVAGSYFEKPGVGRLLRALRCIPVHGTAALDLAAEELSKGWSIAIMPEGRVVPEEEWVDTGVGRAHPGIGRLAIDTGLPVVASGAAGTELLWPRGRSMPRIRPWRRQLLVLRSEVVGPVPDGRSRDAAVRIMDAVARCVAVSEGIRRNSSGR